MGDFRGIKVLLVEDEGGVALLLEDLLEELGCELVASLARLKPAYDALEATSPQLAILDVNVAGELSFDLARMLAKRGVPFLFSTGYGSGGLPDELHSRPVLTKPFTIADLRTAISLALGVPRADACPG